MGLGNSQQLDLSFSPNGGSPVNIHNIHYMDEVVRRVDNSYRKVMEWLCIIKGHSLGHHVTLY